MIDTSFHSFLCVILVRQKNTVDRGHGIEKRSLSQRLVGTLSKGEANRLPRGEKAWKKTYCLATRLTLWDKNTAGATGNKLFQKAYERCGPTPDGLGEQPVSAQR